MHTASLLIAASSALSFFLIGFLVGALRCFLISTHGTVMIVASSGIAGLAGCHRKTARKKRGNADTSQKFLQIILIHQQPPL